MSLKVSVVVIYHNMTLCNRPTSTKFVSQKHLGSVFSTVNKTRTKKKEQIKNNFEMK